MALGVGRDPFARAAGTGLNAHASACITPSLSPEIRRRISAHWHSLSGAKAILAFGLRRAIAALGIRGATVWQFEF